MTIRKFNQPTGKVPVIAVAAGLGILGFVAYKFWWLPNAQAALAAKAAQDPAQRQAAEALLAQAQALQAKNPGMTLQGAFEKLGTVGCQAVGAYYGVPPQASGGVCALAVHLGTELGIQTSKYAAKGLQAAGGAAYQGGKALLKFDYKVGKAVLYDVPKYTLTKTFEGAKYVGYTAPVALTRGTARAVNTSARYVGNKLESGASAVGSGIKSGVGKVTSFFGF